MGVGHACLVCVVMKSLVVLALLGVAASAVAEGRNASFVVYSYPDQYSWSNVRPPHYPDYYHDYEDYVEYKDYKRYKDFKDMKDMKDERRPLEFDKIYHDRTYYYPKSRFYQVVGLREICERPIVFYVYNPEKNYLSGCVLERGFYEIVENKCSPYFTEKLYGPGEKIGLVFYGGSFYRNEFRDFPIKHIEFPTGVRVSSVSRIGSVYKLPFFLVVDAEYFPVFNKEYVTELGRLEVSDYVKIVKDVTHHNPPKH